jgi:RNA polymerase sigma-70 factor (sigma-E family)
MSLKRDEEFTQYVATRLGTLRRIAYLLCQDWHRADDLVQITITRLYVHWGRASTVDYPDAYARTILVRQYFSEQRSGWARRVSLDAEMPDRPAAQLDADATLDVRAALAAIAPRQRATLVLRFYCDLSVEQAADLLGCSEGTVKSQTARGIAALRNRLGPDWQPGRHADEPGGSAPFVPGPGESGDAAARASDRRLPGDAATLYRPLRLPSR